jgi:uncharacterized repeat protein (TIGR03803 family)
MQRLRSFQFVLPIMLVLLVFAITSAQAQLYTETVLYSFAGKPDGTSPYAGVVQDAQGNLYGTTYLGGTSNMGTVFMVDTTGKETVLYSFTGMNGDGANPFGGLVRDTQGNLYGTTYQGGNLTCGPPVGCGTVFKLDTTGKETVLHTFSSVGGDGTGPQAGLVQDTQGNLYGTTITGGTDGAGTVFKVDTTGKETVLYSFGSAGGDGTLPDAGLVLDSQGNLYGTTRSGGTAGDGTVFKVDKTGKETVLYSFTGMNGDGLEPYHSGVVRDAQGNLYGTTIYGGSSVFGTVFKVDTTGKETVLSSFTGGTKDGAYPEAGLVQDTQGNLYGTTFEGGASGGGTVFKVDTSGKETVQHNFFTGGIIKDGAYPLGGLVLDMQGNLYGTTTAGGASAGGIVFKLTPHPALQFVAVTPCRLVDTRNPDGEFGGPPLQGNMVRSFTIPDNKDCNIPSSAAYSLNVTVVPHGPLGYLTVWPTGENQPVVSTLNSYDGRVKANAAIVPSGTEGAISFYVTDTTDLVLDIDGYFAPVSSSTLAFYTLPPCRVADTRGKPGDLGGPYLKGGVNRDFPVLEAPCTIPGSAKAYSLNFTAVPHGPLGYLTVCPTPSDPSQNCPLISTLNSYGGQVVANAAIVPAGVGGKIRIFPYNDTDLIIDIDGYFAPPGQGSPLSLYPLTPCRVLDTRPHPFQFELSPPVDVLGSACAPPSQSQAYVFNASVVPQGGLDYLTLWPDGGGRPVVSTLNAYDGVVSSNMAIVPAGSQGKVDAYANPVNPSDQNDVTDLILDISSCFAP